MELRKLGADKTIVYVKASKIVAGVNEREQVAIWSVPTHQE